MGSARLLLALLLGGTTAADAQSPTFGLGRAPTAEEVAAWDISIHPVTGAELPEGSGTVEEGRLVYRRNCARCHGAEGVDGDAPRLVAREARPGQSAWSRGRILPIRAPYATVVWDYINRGMPMNREGTLDANEVYAITALLLYWNGVIEEDDVMDRESLPAIQMPNRDAWAPLPDWQPAQPRWPGYPY
jgi:cytochrome c